MQDFLSKKESNVVVVHCNYYIFFLIKNLKINKFQAKLAKVELELQFVVFYYFLENFRELIKY